MKARQALALMAVGLGLMAGPARAQTTVELGEWYMCAPMGHPALKDMAFPEKPEGLTQTRNYNYFFTTILSAGGMYPMDQVLDLDATYKGPMTANSQGDEAEVRWQKVSGGGLISGNKIIAYFSTWISVPQDCQAQVLVRSYRNSGYNATETLAVNGSFLNSKRAEKQNPPVTHPVSGQTVALKQGWNHIFSRHLVGWGRLENNVALVLPADIAAQAVVSAEPPAEVGRKFTVAGQAAGAAAPAPYTPKASTPAPKKPASKPAPAPASGEAKPKRKVTVY